MDKDNFTVLGRLHRNEKATPMGVLVDPGDVIGYKANGDPIHLIGGGARNTYEDWIPEEWGGAVITRVTQVSAVERLARREPMGTDTKHVPRSAGVGVAAVAKGAAYAEDTSTNDQVLLTAVKLGRAIRIADEDLQDTSRVADIVATKQYDWATSYGKFLDNACLATSADGNGTTVPFDSVYYSLTQTNSATGYTANANIVSSGAITYTNLSNALSLYEDSDYFDEDRSICIASPVFRKKLRDIKDDQNQPIFVRGQGGDAGTPDTVFGIPVAWSLGCRLAATATDAPTSAMDAIMVFGNRDYLILGVRSGPETRTAGADTGAAFLTDEALLKMRARRGFAVGHEKAFAVLVDSSS